MCSLFVIEDDDGLMVELPDDGFNDAVPKSLRQAEDRMAEMEMAEMATALVRRSQKTTAMRLRSRPQTSRPALRWPTTSKVEVPIATRLRFQPRISWPFQPGRPS